ncbi:L,D-transpeptidase [Orenia marismortui]|uniref:L,D-transpeptidase n=1 Tax=Orenia marismortui TaxID=46469 RepID=UPI00037E1C31|nr:L,D-transpeptidase [Orenia marismortui]
MLKSTSDKVLITILIILIIIMLILMFVLANSYSNHEKQIDIAPVIDYSLYNDINKYLKADEKEEYHKSIKLIDTLNNLYRLRMALLLYIEDHHRLPSELEELLGEYLVELPVEVISNTNQVNSELDLTGGWYYNPTDIELEQIVKESLRANIKDDYSQEINFIPYRILIVRAKKRLYLVQGDNKIKSYPIGIGSVSNPTPSGEFRVKNKARLSKEDKERYGEYWVGIDLWTKGGGYGIHATTTPQVVITKQNSKGCIRMKEEDIVDLYNLIPLRTKVIIK